MKASDPLTSNPIADEIIETIRASCAAAKDDPTEFFLSVRIICEELQARRAGFETVEPLPPGTEVVITGGLWAGCPRDGWVIETRDFPRPLMYRIRHPNGSLIDVLPECIALSSSLKS